MSYQIKTFKYKSADYEKAVVLRDQVLRQPLGLSFTAEELKKDENDMHFGLFAEEEIVACLILSHVDETRIKMRQVAVADKFQGQGLGRLLNNAAEEYAKSKNFTTIFCHARKSAAPFYLSLGYKITSTEFTEVNIPHFIMEKRLIKV